MRDSMNTDEKSLARTLFKNKICKADGQKFEDIFTQIMNYYEGDFRQIQPWGQQGDRANDGCIPDKGIYYQVFAPKDIRKSHDQVIKKIQEDFKTLLKSWSPIKEFYFVLNDRYDDVSPDCLQTIQTIKSEYQLENAGLLTAKDLENMLFELKDDQIITITGHLPDFSKIKNIDYSILNEVIGHIMNMSITSSKANTNFPDWGKKIKFNGLSDFIKSWLDNASMQLGTLEEYFKNESNFLADTLRDQINGVYQEKKSQGLNEDCLFIDILKSISPREKKYYEDATLVIMAKYFESCDIFEEPITK